MHVPMLSIVFIVLNMLLGIALPLGLMVAMKRKLQCSLVPFFVGCGTMLLFALVLEQIVHSIVLSSPAGAMIQGNLWLIALYGGFMAALFEETGRFLAMKYALRKHHGNDRNGLMYGAGHGGFECMMILTLGMVNNLIYAVMLNTGNAEMLLAPLDAANRAVVEAAFATLAQTSPFLFLLSAVERGAALLAQIAMSVPMWFAATRKGKGKYYFVSFGFHFLLDAVSAIISRLGLPVILVEAVIWALALAFAWYVKGIWEKERKKEYEDNH